MTLEIISELTKLDTNAAKLFPKLLKKSGATVDKQSGEIIRDRRGLVLKSFGIPDLMFRLECQREREKRNQDEIARARIWFHVAEASAAGENIPDVSDNKHLLNPWIVTPSLKFPNPRLEILNNRDRESKPRRNATEIERECIGCGRTFKAHRKTAKFCSTKCQSKLPGSARVQPAKIVSVGY